MKEVRLHLRWLSLLVPLLRSRVREPACPRISRERVLILATLSAKHRPSNRPLKRYDEQDIGAHLVWQTVVAALLRGRIVLMFLGGLWRLVVELVLVLGDSACTRARLERLLVGQDGSALLLAAADKCADTADVLGRLISLIALGFLGRERPARVPFIWSVQRS